MHCILPGRERGEFLMRVRVHLIHYVLEKVKGGGMSLLPSKKLRRRPSVDLRQGRNTSGTLKS